MRTLVLLMINAGVLWAQGPWIMRPVAGGGPRRMPAGSASVNGPVGLCGSYVVAREAGRVYRLESDGTISIAADGLDAPVACVVGADGALLVAENQRVGRLPVDQPTAIALDGNGVLYIATARAIFRESSLLVNAGAQALVFDAQGRLVFAERDQNRVRRLELNGTVTMVASANAPRALAVDDRGVLYVAEKDRVRRLDTNAAVAEVSAAAIAFDRDALLTAEETGHRVRRWTAGRAVVAAGNGTPGLSGDGGPALDASLLRPQGIWASDTELLIGDTGNNAIRRVDLGSGVIATVAGANQPWGVARDLSGNLFIGEPDRVRRISPEGQATTLAGGGSLMADTGVATQARLLEPIAVSADEDGNVFLAERGSNKLRRVTPDGGLSTVAGTGQNRVADSMVGGALAMPVASPPAIAFDGRAVFYTDETAHVVGRVESGRLEIVAGTRWPAAGVAAAGPSAATKTPLLRPRGVAADGNGGFFVTEEGAGRVRQVDAEGVMRTIAEGLRQPAHLAFVPPCTLYVAESGSHVVQRLRPEVRFTVRPEPAHLLLTIDGETGAGTRVFSWEGFTQHVLLAPSPQDDGEGTRFVAPPAQMIDLACVPAEQSLTVAFGREHRLTIEAGEGGTVSRESGWIEAGAEVVLEARAREGFVFAGWEGACAGGGACTVRVDGPVRVRAVFRAPE